MNAFRVENALYELGTAWAFPSHADVGLHTNLAYIELVLPDSCMLCTLPKVLAPANVLSGDIVRPNFTVIKSKIACATSCYLLK